MPLYAAYGSNMHPEQMLQRAPHSPMTGTGWLHGWRLTFAGEDITAQRAYDLGLINHVVPDGQALAKAKEIAQRIARNGPLAVQGILATLRATEAMPEEQAFVIEMEHGKRVMSSNDAAEGPRAFLEKRDPEFTGT